MAAASSSCVAKMVMKLPGVTKLPTRAGSERATDTASLPVGTWMSFSPTGLSPHEAARTYCPGAMSVSARSALLSSVTWVSAPAGTPAAGTWVWVSILSLIASRMLVPAGMASDEVKTVRGLAAATARASALRA